MIKSGGNIKIYKKYKRIFFIRILIFKIIYQKKKDICPFLIDSKYEIKSDDVLEIMLLCIMSHIDDIDLLQSYREIPIKLEEVAVEKTEIAEIARKMARFLGRQGTYHGQLISMHGEQELIDLFFN